MCEIYLFLNICNVWFFFFWFFPYLVRVHTTFFVKTRRIHERCTWTRGNTNSREKERWKERSGRGSKKKWNSFEFILQQLIPYADVRSFMLLLFVYYSFCFFLRRIVHSIQHYENVWIHRFEKLKIENYCRYTLPRSRLCSCIQLELNPPFRQFSQWDPSHHHTHTHTHTIFVWM